LNKQLGSTIAGLLCISLGLLSLIQDATGLYGEQVSGIFGSIVSDSPTQKVAAMSCPAEWADNKPGVASVTVQNPLSKPLTYKVTLSTYSSSNPPQYEPSQTVTIPANEKATISWSLAPTGISAYYRFAQVFAYSDEDSAKPQFHMWPSSFTGICDIRLLNNPAFSALRLRALGGVLGILLGSILVYLPNRPLGRNQRLAAVLFGAVIVVIPGAALSYIFLAAKVTVSWGPVEAV
jgi:hypothetical protein